MHAFLTLAGLIVFLQLNFNEKLTYKNEKNFKFVIGLIFFLFLFYQYFTGGKAAILQILFMVFLISISISRVYDRSRIVFLSRKIFLVLILFSPVLYVIVLFKRISIGSGLKFNFENIFVLLSQAQYLEMYHNIMLRLSANGIDRYFLTFNSFIVDSYSPSVAIDYLTYASKNTINLLMPGTIFPEAYAPSGQLFSQIINKDFTGWSGGSDLLYLLKSLNTSAYTAIGDAIVLTGLFAPLLLFISTISFLFLFYQSVNPIIRTVLIFLFFSALFSYGLDGIFGDSFNLLISMIVIFFSMRLFQTFLQLSKRIIKL